MKDFEPIELAEAERIAGEVVGESCSIVEQDQAVGPKGQCRDMLSSENSSENSSEEEKVEFRPFFGQENFKTAYSLQKEEPQHRVICFLAAEGNTTTEIAEKTGFTTAMVAYVKKQPWAQQKIAELIEKHGGKGVRNVLQSNALKAAQVLIDVMNGAIESRPETRAKCANDILNRVYGTAPQIVMHGKVDPAELSDEELAAMAQSATN